MGGLWLIMLLAVEVTEGRSVKNLFERSNRDVEDNSYRALINPDYTNGIYHAIGMKPYLRSDKANKTIKKLYQHSFERFVATKVKLQPKEEPGNSNKTGNITNVQREFPGMVKLSTLGTKVENLSIAITHKKYQTIILPYQKQMFLAKIFEVEKAIQNAAGQIMSVGGEFTKNLSRRMDGKTPYEIEKMCRLGLEKENKNITTACEEIALNRFLSYLNRTTHQLLHDAQFRITDMRRSVDGLSFWLGRDEKIERNNRTKREISSEVSGIFNYELEEERLNEQDLRQSLIAVVRVLSSELFGKRGNIAEILKAMK